MSGSAPRRCTCRVRDEIGFPVGCDVHDGASPLEDDVELGGPDDFAAAITARTVSPSPLRGAA